MFYGKIVPELEKEYKDINFDHFKFAYRRSIEHWYPQNPNGHDGRANYLRSFTFLWQPFVLLPIFRTPGFGSYPEAKLKQWEEEDIFHRQSLKLQMMAEIT